MARKKSRKAKVKKTKKRSAPKRTDLDVLKQQANYLFPRVRENLAIVLKQTGIDSNELSSIIQKYGYDAISTLDGFDIAEPIWKQMVKTFQIYDKVSGLIERLDVAQNRLFIDQLEKKTVEMEAQVKTLEDEEKFYTEKDRDKDGLLKLKPKWYAEKEYWEIKKSEALQKLNQEPTNNEAKAHLTQAEAQIKVLNQKKAKVRLQNIQPTITKGTLKIGKIISGIQQSIGEVSKPFADVGKASGSGDANVNQFEHFFEDGSRSKGKKQEKNEFEGFFGE